MPLLQKEFEGMIAATYDSAPSADQLDQLRMAFFGGAGVVMANADQALMLRAEIDDYMTEAEQRVLAMLAPRARNN